MKLTHRSTILACYNGYITQAICINLAPLLYLTFQREFSLSVTQVGLLIAVNFATQILVDLLASNYADRLNLRAMAILAHIFAAGGLIGLSLFPKFLPPLWGLLLAEAILGLGGGFTEVIISPLMEACPTEEKSGSMSLLHSFYCWGQAGVVLLSGIYFYFFEISTSWHYLPIIWSVIPLAGAVAFAIVPIYTLPTKEGERSPVARLFRTPLFLVFFLMMYCAGAGEMVMSQWASAFVESALGIDKALGDLLGPCMFAALMGISRVIYAKYSQKLNLYKYIVICALVCVAGYLVAVFSPNQYLSLAAIGVIGFSVGIIWPGTLSLASSRFPLGGATMFAYLAIFGDIGCTVGPALAAAVSEKVSLFASPLKAGIAACTIFPVLVIVLTLILKKTRKDENA